MTLYADVTGVWLTGVVVMFRRGNGTHTYRLYKFAISYSDRYVRMSSMYCTFLRFSHNENSTFDSTSSKVHGGSGGGERAVGRMPAQSSTPDAGESD